MNEKLTPEDRIQAAIDIALQYGQIDGGHHRVWVIDQMIRALTGCPILQKPAVGPDGPYTFDADGESEEYADLIRKANEGEDGPDTYMWDTGIAP